MRILTTLPLLIITLSLQAQTAGVRGQLQGPGGEAVPFANVALFSAADSSLSKAGTSDESGVFDMKGLSAGTYFLKTTGLGFKDFQKSGISLESNRQLDLGVLTLAASDINLAEATVTASRVMVEVKPDRTIFNVDGTINSAGSDAITLLRKAPSVTVDNNDNINVLGRSGVLLYVDGKRMPLTGADLVSFLQSLPAEQIDRIEIITNPGAKYEAEGNAGIIDIRLKKDKNLGANGSVNTTYSQGEYHRANLNGNANYRNKRVNIFGNAGIGDGAGFMDMNFLSYQNGMVQEEINNHQNDW
ncbi:MAG TPA: TonB-dependent receptor, partial [Saprospiraceae bacterium]|nr:TonB-dependent receptor [Saprospiraceae bacterium]